MMAVQIFWYVLLVIIFVKANVARDEIIVRVHGLDIG